MNDGTMLMKKENGDVVVLDANDSIFVANKDGEVQEKDDGRFKVRYTFNKYNNTNQITDMMSNHRFKVSKHSKVTRKNGIL